MIGFWEIGCHIVFDIKMDFTRKARFFPGNWLPHCFQYQDGLHEEGKILCWGLHCQYSNGNDIFKCCFKGQCSNWFNALLHSMDWT
jgi:hypothetical protein